MEHIETERLILRMLTPRSYGELMQGSDEEIMKCFGYTVPEELAREKQKFTEGLTGFNRSFRYFIMVEKTTGRVIGSCGFHTWFLPHRRAEIGYDIRRETDKRKGYMTEAITAIIQHGFEKMDLNRIEAMIGPGNAASIATVQRQGFTQEGLLRSHYCKDNEMQDSLVFSLLREEYKSRQNP